MRYKGPMPHGAIRRFNACVGTLHSSPRWGHLVSRRFTIVTYTGRRSGRTFSTPVAYRQVAGVVTIGVRLAEAKTWWRNFTGEGHPISLQIDGADRTGHAVAERDARGRVTIAVHLD